MEKNIKGCAGDGRMMGTTGETVRRILFSAPALIFFAFVGYQLLKRK